MRALTMVLIFLCANEAVAQRENLQRPPLQPAGPARYVDIVGAPDLAAQLRAYMAEGPSARQVRCIADSVHPEPQGDASLPPTGAMVRAALVFEISCAHARAAAQDAFFDDGQVRGRFGVAGAFVMTPPIPRATAWEYLSAETFDAVCARSDFARPAQDAACGVFAEPECVLNSDRAACSLLIQARTFRCEMDGDAFDAARCVADPPDQVVDLMRPIVKPWQLLFVRENGAWLFEASLCGHPMDAFDRCSCAARPGPLQSSPSASNPSGLDTSCRPSKLPFPGP